MSQKFDSCTYNAQDEEDCSPIGPQDYWGKNIELDSWKFWRKCAAIWSGRGRIVVISNKLMTGEEKGESVPSNRMIQRITFISIDMEGIPHVGKQMEREDHFASSNNLIKSKSKLLQYRSLFGLCAAGTRSCTFSVDFCRPSCFRFLSTSFSQKRSAHLDETKLRFAALANILVIV